MELMIQHCDCIFQPLTFDHQKQKCDVFSMPGDCAEFLLTFFVYTWENWSLVLRRNKFSKICRNFWLNSPQSKLQNFLVCIGWWWKSKNSPIHWPEELATFFYAAGNLRVHRRELDNHFFPFKTFFCRNKYISSFPIPSRPQTYMHGNHLAFLLESIKRVLALSWGTALRAIRMDISYLS